jgi:adenylate cyclase
MPTESLEAYDSFLRAERSLFSQNSEELAAALSHYRKATEIDPNFARAWAGHARAAVDILRFDWFDVMPGHHARRQAYESASRALLLDPYDARAYSVLAILQMVDSRHDESIETARKAVILSPSDADALLNLALVLSYAGEHDEAIRTMKAALKLNPKPPSGFYRLTGFIQFMSRNYEEAENLLIKARNVSSPDPSYEELAMVYAQMGKTNQANAEVDGMLTLWPEANLTYYRVLYSHHKRQEDLDFRINALRKAGLPQWPYGYEGREEDRLTHKEIKHLLFDRIWRGFRVGAEEFNRENNEDGIVGFRDPLAHPGRSSSAYLLSGTATIDGDKLCYQYEEFLLGRKYCGYVFRNPKGSDREKNAYVDVNAIVIDYFTAGPEGSVR